MHPRPQIRRASPSALIGVVFLLVTGCPTSEPATGSEPGPDEPPTVPPTVGDPPTAVCGVSVGLETGELVEVLHACPNGMCPEAVWSGGLSFDPLDLPLSFEWTLSAPVESSTSLSSHTSIAPVAGLDVAGSYSATLVVTNSNGQASAPCTATAVATPAEDLRVELSWSVAGDDLDLHLLRASPPGEPRTEGDCYFANCQSGGRYQPLDWGVPGLEEDDPRLQDDWTGTGPEIANLALPAGAPYEGWYQVFVHDYAGRVFEGPNEAIVRIYLEGELEETLVFSLVGEDDDHYVAKIEWPSRLIVPCDGLAGCPP